MGSRIINRLSIDATSPFFLLFHRYPSTPIFTPLCGSLPRPLEFILPRRGKDRECCGRPISQELKYKLSSIPSSLLLRSKEGIPNNLRLKKSQSMHGLRPSSWRRSFGLDASQSDVPFQQSSENRRLRIFTVAHLPLHLLHRKSWPHLQLSKHRAWPSRQRKRPPQRQRRTTTEQSRPTAPTSPTLETLLTPPIPNWPRPTPLSPLNIHQIISPVSSAGRKKMSIFEDIESVKKEEQILSETKN